MLKVFVRCLSPLSLISLLRRFVYIIPCRHESHPNQWKGHSIQIRPSHQESRNWLTHRKQNLKKKKAKIFKCDSVHWLKITKYHQLDRPWISKSEILTQKIVAAKKKKKKKHLNLKTSRTIFSRVSTVRFLSNIQVLLGYNILPHRYPHLSYCFLGRQWRNEARYHLLQKTVKSHDLLY